MEWLAAWLKGLTFTNVAIIALMAMVAIPVYATYKFMTDPALLDRWMSSYDEYTEVESGCTVRTVRLRGGPWHWSVSTGFAGAGGDRYNVAVILANEPDKETIASYCATLDLIVDKMLGTDSGALGGNGRPRRTAGRRVLRFAVPRAAADEGRHKADLRQGISGPDCGSEQGAARG